MNYLERRMEHYFITNNLISKENCNPYFIFFEDFVKNLNESDTTTMDLDSALLGVYKRQLFCEPLIEKIETEVEISGIPLNLDLGWAQFILEEVDCIDDHCFYVSGNLTIKFGSEAKK